MSSYHSKENQNVTYKRRRDTKREILKDWNPNQVTCNEKPKYGKRELEEPYSKFGIFSNRTRYEHNSTSKMAVVHFNHPHSEISEKQALLVHIKILDELKKSYSSLGNKLEVINIKYKDGMLWVTCGSTLTVNWVWETVHSLHKEDNGLSLRVIEERYVNIK